MEKISVDFDSTLSEEDVQDFVKKLLDMGFIVFIITSRVDNEYAKLHNWWWIEKQNKQLFDIAESLGIDKKNIIFTQLVDKIEYIEGKDFLLHLDDSDEEINLINESNDNCVGVLKDLHSEWIKKCEDLIS